MGIISFRSITFLCLYSVITCTSLFIRSYIFLLLFFRLAICRKVLDGILDKIDRNEDAERKKEEKKRAKEENQALRLERQKANKLSILLQKRKEALKRELMRKRDLLERDLILELQQQQQTIKNKRKQGATERRNSQSTPEGPKAKKKKIEEERLFCICKKPYDPSQ